MEGRALAWTLALCTGLALWLYLDVNSTRLYTNWHKFLLDNETGATIEPRQLIDLAKIIDVTDEYVERTNAFGRLHDLVQQVHLESAYARHFSYSKRDELEMSGWPVSNQTRCGQELDWILDKLRQNPQYQLLRGQLGRELTTLMDSFGKFESGTYSGLTFWLGSYKHCLRASLNGGAIRTRYCVAKMRPKWWPEQERVSPASRINIGACLPETCDTLSFANHKVQLEQLIKLELPDSVKTSLIFDDLYCLPDERSPIRRVPLAGRILLALLFGWLAVVLLATIGHARANKRRRPGPPPPPPHEAASIKTKPNSLQLLLKADGGLAAVAMQPPLQERAHEERTWSERIMEAVAIQGAWRELTRTSARGSSKLNDGQALRVDLRGLDFLKVLMTLCIVIAHCFYVTSFFIRSIANRVEESTQEKAPMVMAIGQLVDTFFVLFGLLAAYSLLKRYPIDQLTSPLIWFGYNFHVLARVGPIFVLVYCYSRFLEPLTGSGPWWEYGTSESSVRFLCRHEAWYRALPHFGIPATGGDLPGPACNGPSWFLVAYCRIGLLLPIVTHVLCKLPNQASRLLLVGYMICIAALQLSLKMLKQTTLRGESFSLYGGFLLALFEKFESTGVMATLGRLGSTTVGCYLGYLLRMYEIGEIKDWPRWLVSRITLTLALGLHVGCLLLPLAGYYLNRGSGHKSTLVEFLVGQTVVNLVWLCSLALLLICCLTTYNRSRLVRFACHAFWCSFSRLGLCIYVIHFSILIHGSTSYEQAPSHGFFDDTLKLLGYGLLFTIPLSLLVHLLFEAPMTRLLKLFIS